MTKARTIFLIVIILVCFALLALIKANKLFQNSQITIQHASTSEFEKLAQEFSFVHLSTNKKNWSDDQIKAVLKDCQSGDACYTGVKSTVEHINGVSFDKVCRCTIAVAIQDLSYDDLGRFCKVVRKVATSAKNEFDFNKTNDIELKKIMETGSYAIGMGSASCGMRLRPPESPHKLLDVEKLMQPDGASFSMSQRFRFYQETEPGMASWFSEEDGRPDVSNTYYFNDIVAKDRMNYSRLGVTIGKSGTQDKAQKIFDSIIHRKGVLGRARDSWLTKTTGLDDRWLHINDSPMYNSSEPRVEFEEFILFKDLIFHIELRQLGSNALKKADFDKIIELVISNAFKTTRSN